jgi:hypothetical protein
MGHEDALRSLLPHGFAGFGIELEACVTMDIQE